MTLSAMCAQYRLPTGSDSSKSVKLNLLWSNVRLDAGLRERAAEELLGGDHPVLRVEEDAVEAFVAEILHAQPQVRAHGRGRGEAVARLHLLGERTPRELHHRADARIAHAARGAERLELGGCRREQARQPPEARDEAARVLH